MVEVTHRERKRAQTRQRISDTATRLFERDGFESVTLAQIATAADVSVKTVTNYFGAKEDLFFDAEPAVLATLTAAIQGSEPASATAALRPLLLEGPLLAGPCPWARVDADLWQGMRDWTRCESESVTLRNRRSSILQSWLVPLAGATGSMPWAALMIGALALRHHLLQEGLLEGASPAVVDKRMSDVVGQALDAIEVGFGPPAR
ncbi:TetR/AcrR family transcriptional regulator [Nocardia sp. NPDC050435]|uniref:TetR/AcrR family transcriptional regulator n=1 Tax=Nocardia sp. NPDC050435 TaxID=3155040 RepID=UPI0033C01448